MQTNFILKRVEYRIGMYAYGLHRNLQKMLLHYIYVIYVAIQVTRCACYLFAFFSRDLFS